MNSLAAWAKRAPLFLLILGYFCSLWMWWPGAVGTDMQGVLIEAQGGGPIGGHFAPMFTLGWRIISWFVPISAAVSMAFGALQFGYWAVFFMLAQNALRIGSTSCAWLALLTACLPPLLCFSIGIESNVINGVAWTTALAYCAVRRDSVATLHAAPLVIIGFFSRYGTIVAALPVVAAMLFLSRPSMSKFRVVWITMAIGAALQSISMLVPKLVLGDPSNSSVVSISQLFDLAGIYDVTGQHSIPAFAVPEGARAEDVLANYDIMTCSPLFWRSDDKPVFIRPSNAEQEEELRQVWIQTIRSNFVGYLEVKRRFAACFLMIGYKHAMGPNPDFTGGARVGIDVPPDPEAHTLTRYARWTQTSLVWRPWLWLSTTLAVVIVGFVARARSAWPALAAMIAACLSLVPHLLLGQAVVCRYYFPAFLLCALAVFLVAPELLCSWRLRRREGSGCSNSDLSR